MDTEKISVIVPVYNVEKYLANCIESILSQTLYSLELILINDGSRDRSGVICDKYSHKDTRVKVFHIENNGVSNARNFGIDQAQGKYILFVDSDDTIETNMLEEMYSMAEEKKYDLVLCGMKFIYSDGCIRKLSYPSRSLKNKHQISKEIHNLVEEYLIYAPCNKLYNTNILKLNNIKFNSSTSFLEDVLFNIEVFKIINSLCILEDAYYNYYKRNTQSLLHNFYRNKYEISSFVNNSIIELYKNHEIYNSRNESFLKNRHMELLYNSVFDLLADSCRKMSYKECHEYYFKIVKDEDFSEYLKQKQKQKQKQGHAFLILKTKSFLAFWIYMKISFAMRKGIGNNNEN